MKRLKLVEFGKPLQMAEEPDPIPKGNEVVLEVLSCGICHSDLHLSEGYYDLGDGDKMWVKDRGVHLPMTPGHEIVGKVLKTGENANRVQIGETKLVYPWIGCMNCPECNSGNFQKCLKPRSLGIYQNGGFGSQILIPDEKFLVGIGDLRPEVACSYACAGLTSYSALKKSMPWLPSQTLVVIGAGGLGLIAAQLIPLLGGVRTIFVDVNIDSLEEVKNSNPAFITIDSKKEDALSRITQLTDGLGADRIIDFVNNTQTAQLAFSALKKNGKQIPVGLFGGRLSVPTPILALKNITIQGSYTGSLVELQELMSLVIGQHPKPIPIQTKSLEEVNSVLEKIKLGEVHGRSVVTVF